MSVENDNEFGTVGYIFAFMVLIPFRTICRTAKSCLANVFNIFIGIKHMVDLTQQSKNAVLGWILFVIKLPFVIAIGSIKLILTATLGTLYNFFESIFMAVRFCFSNDTRKLKTKKLYRSNYNEDNNKEQEGNTPVELIWDFALGNIDIENEMSEKSKEIKNKEWIKKTITGINKATAWCLELGLDLEQDNLIGYAKSLECAFDEDKYKTSLSQEFKTVNQSQSSNSNPSSPSGNGPSPLDPQMNSIVVSSILGSIECL